MADQSISETQAKPARRAAQYIRMSTEHQQYSTENQANAVRDYAERRGYEIVRTYADEGKSGLRIEGRDQLRQLIADVEHGDTDFQTILVYDISRWGRFQDADESAYYEYVCKRAGIDVQYCAEQFENDGSTQATIFKSVKRAMAGEYSRELSVKVFQGQCNLIEKGFRQGGTAGYGLRRMLVDQTGQPKGVLARGEHKSLQTDRVILVPGPEDEQNIVRRIYQLFIHEDHTERQVADLLNKEQVSSESGRPWTRGMVHQIITNEKYIGHNVYNRVSFKLKKKRVQNAPEMWIRAENAFDAIIEPQVYYTAQGIMLERNRRFTDDEMLSRLKSLVDRHQRISGILIDESEDMPSSAAYRNRFGTLIRAYRLIGYTPERDYEYVEINRHLRKMHPEIVSDTVSQIEKIGGEVEQDDESDLLLINDEFTASIVLSRCRQTGAGSMRWLVHLDQSLRPDITVVVRMCPTNDSVTDYYLLPWIDLCGSRLSLSSGNGASLDTYRFDDLTYFWALARRCRIEVAA